MPGHGYAQADVSELSPMTPATPRDRTLALVLGAVVLGALIATGIFLLLKHDEGGAELHAKPSNTLLLATRDLARLETSEMHVEKVIDSTDTQSRFFGLVEGTDNVLLVAVGDVTLGVDLGKIKDGDVTLDETSHTAHFKLAAPEVFSSRLDERATYVYSRNTSLVAKRNEQLESKARQEAQETIRKQADTEEARQRAKNQAEKVLRQLATSLGATTVTFDWR